MRIGIRPPQALRWPRVQAGPAFEEMLNSAVSGDILKKDFRLVTFGRCKGVPQGQQGTRLRVTSPRGFLGR